MNSQSDLVTVIMPAYNASRFIIGAIESVCKQTHRNLELIVVDDGSTDDTRACVELAMREDSRITLLQSENRGVSHARNLGIASARGECIATIDADDLWKREKIARQYELLRRSPETTGVVYCWAAGINDRREIVLPVWNDSLAVGNVLHAIVETGILSNGSTPLMKTRFVKAVGGYDESIALGEDWKFYTALAGLCDFAVIPECLTGYHIRDDSSSVQVAPMEAALERTTEWIRKRWPELPEELFRKRAFTIQCYLAFLTIRARNYAVAPRHLLNAVSAYPRGALSLRPWELMLLTFVHAAGVRRYEWALWRKPAIFEE